MRSRPRGLGRLNYQRVEHGVNILIPIFLFALTVFVILLATKRI
jgi:hypothetical protein